jgi:hypothetical protein
MRLRQPTPWLLALSVVSALSIACSDSTNPGSPNPSPLAGLRASGTNDSNSTPPPSQSATPGSFRGTVMGHADFAPGTDTLATLPRIVGATLVAYVHTDPTSSDDVGVGAQVASTTTDANGMFQFPTLPGGIYVVTITPPEGSAYQGVWVTATAHSHSADYGWWVVLPVK